MIFDAIALGASPGSVHSLRWGPSRAVAAGICSFLRRPWPFALLHQLIVTVLCRIARRTQLLASLPRGGMRWTQLIITMTQLIVTMTQLIVTMTQLIVTMHQLLLTPRASIAHCTSASLLYRPSLLLLPAAIILCAAATSRYRGSLHHVASSCSR